MQRQHVQRGILCCGRLHGNPSHMTIKPRQLSMEPRDGRSFPSREQQTSDNFRPPSATLIHDFNVVRNRHGLPELPIFRIPHRPVSTIVPTVVPTRGFTFGFQTGVPGVPRRAQYINVATLLCW